MSTDLAAATTAVPVTSNNAAFVFYDIESLSNVFTLAAFTPRTDKIDMFYLIDQDDGDLASAIKPSIPGVDSPTDLDVERAATTIIGANPAYKGNAIDFYDLSTWGANVALAELVGLSNAEKVNDPSSKSKYTAHLRPVCDTDPEYDPLEAHPYLAGYNSFNYDTSILSLYFMEAFAHLNFAIDQGFAPWHGFKPTEAKIIRAYNDEMFQDEWRRYMPGYLIDGPPAEGEKWDSVPFRIRQAMMHSGRHIDVARFNEVQKFVALKRLLGGMGRQIMESDKLGVHNSYVESAEDFYELLAYNVSDVVGLHKLFEHPTYSSGFDLKKGLLDEYPETIYDKQRQAYAPDIRARSTRRDRLAPDATSAKFVATILAPYGPLDDIPVVSFQYPAQKVADKLDIEPVNVLEETKKFFYESISCPEARAKFDLIYDYYASIEGNNFNNSEEHMAKYPSNPPTTLAAIPKVPNNLPYFKADGTPSTCFATFSTGGIHGAEGAWGAFSEALDEWKANEDLMAEVKRLYPDPLVVRTSKEVTLPNGTVVPHGDVLTSKTTIKALKARSEELAELQSKYLRQRALLQETIQAATSSADKDAAQYLEEAKDELTELGDGPRAEDIAAINEKYKGIGYKPSKPKPEMFKTKADGSTRLDPKYTYTSAGSAIHEDFTSYYPGMLTQMAAFDNPDLGLDRYEKIFHDKERYGAQMKAPELDPVEAAHLKVLREGTKLILNTASGAGDTAFKTPIRMNNTIISMRIIGQLFTYRIAQAQTAAGARIVSTNTDGLYSVGLDDETNNRVLAEQAAKAHMGVAIEPERLIIISKDSNNRLELEPPEDPSTSLRDAKIVSASGASLACHAGPQPSKSLAHPAVLDWALGEYLKAVLEEEVFPWRKTPLSLDEELDLEFAEHLMLTAVANPDVVHAALLFQNIIAASTGKITHPFAADPLNPLDPDPKKLVNPRSLQHYNRMFIVHRGKKGAVSLHQAGSYVVNATSRAKRIRDKEASVVTDRVALEILQSNGFARTRAEASAHNRTLLPEDQDVAVRKLPNIDPSWSIIIENGDLIEMPKEDLAEILGCLDLNIYVGMLASLYDTNWKRKGAAVLDDDPEDDEE